MRALMLWRAETRLDLSAEGENDGVRWTEIHGASAETITARTDDGVVVVVFVRYQAKDAAGNRFTAYVEPGLDPVAALGAWEAGNEEGLVIGDPLHEACGEAALDADDLPLPSELAEGGDADPERAWAWRDHEADERPGADDGPGGDPDDGPIDSEETWRAYVALCEKHRRDPYAFATMK